MRLCCNLTNRKSNLLISTGPVNTSFITSLRGGKGSSYKSLDRSRRAFKSRIAVFDDHAGASKAIEKRRGTVPNFDYSGVYQLLLVNFVIFAADHLFHLPWVSQLYLNHSHPRWWQYLTAAFCHGSWAHISNNAFMLLVFGRIVEEEEGTFGVWATYVLCAIGSSVASVLMQPSNMISLGASGAVFGMFAVSVLTKLQFKFRKLLEFGILGQFVLQQVLNEAKMQSQVWSGGKGLVIAGTQVGHLAHLAGAFAGVMLVFALSKIPAPTD